MDRENFSGNKSLAINYSALVPDFKFEHFQLKEKLIGNGNDQTWLVEDLNNPDNELFMIRFSTKENIKRIYDRIKDLHHKNIAPNNGCRARDEDRDGYLVMHYPKGITLEEWLQKVRDKKGRVPSKKILPILRGIADALDEAHRKGIVHGKVDLKQIRLQYD